MKQCLLAMLSVLLFALAPVRAGAEPVGEVMFTKGAASAAQASQGLRLLAKGAAIFRGDTISTGDNSFVLIRFIDETRLTLRPGSEFSVEEYANERGLEKVSLNLIKGGLRALSGTIPKKAPGQFEVKSLEATLGVRGTDFAARRCGEECAEEEKSLAKKHPVTSTSLVVARVAKLLGDLLAVTPDNPRALSEGAPIYNGDVLESGERTFALVAFRDGTRLTMQPQSLFRIEQYEHDGKGGEFSGELLKGGLRTLTGVIADENPENFALRTPTATLGVRGTGFDTDYQNPTIVRVWLGGINFAVGEKFWKVDTGQILRYLGDGTPPTFIDQVPPRMNAGPQWRPDKLPVDLQDLFGSRELTDVLAGFYAYVRDGHVVVRGKHLGAGESLYASLDELFRISPVPAFLEFDVTPGPDSNIRFELLNLVADGLAYEQSCLVR